VTLTTAAAGLDDAERGSRHRAAEAELEAVGMTITDGMGYVAASLVLATFCAKRMVSLRALAISSNVAFITYGLAAHLWPILILHAVMLPLNLVRLRDALASPGQPDGTGSGATIKHQLT
jgi:hypothetical protein